MQSTLGEEIAKLGWCSGSVVPSEMVSSIQKYLVSPHDQAAAVTDDDWLIVVSQTCDVVAPSIKSEPYIEVLHCRPTVKLRSQFQALRSTRQLDFKPNIHTHASICLNAHAIADRYLVPRELFCDKPPRADKQLTPTSINRLLQWYSLRYGRPSWPDTFVSRLGAVKGKLEATLEPLNEEDLAEVRVSIRESDKELTVGDTYHIVVYFVVDANHWRDNVEGRENVYQAYSSFVSLLDQCSGIKVDKNISTVLSGEDFRWQDVQETDLWDFANLCNRD